MLKLFVTWKHFSSSSPAQTAESKNEWTLQAHKLISGLKYRNNNCWKAFLKINTLCIIALIMVIFMTLWTVIGKKFLHMILLVCSFKGVYHCTKTPRNDGWKANGTVIFQEICSGIWDSPFILLNTSHWKILYYLFISLF